jgi:SAM-dependent methyltransferase
MSEDAAREEFTDHFSKLAQLYSAFRPSYPDALFDYLAGLCGERHLAWDCACGSGQATLPLAERFEAVLGTDASAKQVSVATRSPKVEYRAAAATASGLEPESADLVTVAQALHWFDLEPFYREVKRVLRNSGVLAVWTYGTPHVDGDEIDRLIQEFYHDVVGPYWPPERRLVEEGYRGMSFPFIELVPPAFSMQERWERAHLSGYLRTWSATGHYVEHRGVDPVALLEKKLAALWTDPHSTRLVTWPLSLRVGRKT